MYNKNFEGDRWTEADLYKRGDTSATSVVPFKSTHEVACGGNYQLYFTDSEGTLFRKQRTKDNTNLQGDSLMEKVKGASDVVGARYKSITVNEAGILFALREVQSAVKTSGASGSASYDIVMLGSG